MGDRQLKKKAAAAEPEPVNFNKLIDGKIAAATGSGSNAAKRETVRC